MIINGREVKGVMLGPVDKEMVREKLTPKVRQEWLELLEEQDRRIEQWEKEHNF
ncbi:hypothetical protein [Fructobacillus parabroussonetiae]|uniref:Uncharacterized protein n=1 Tax=Fructobacillus parabroussonetiae TaxID=2713174 RepID=A0ABS5QUM3_9LACO|nr:hypothetical protein [Fructobacillus parabroussonetiae]MBS9336889.1 hypothetical protein [Fructobacillus parabroussonetiae]MCK8617502.1 hypothetical protein [Fructobacillus parabroussonetiae]